MHPLKLNKIKTITIIAQFLLWTDLGFGLNMTQSTEDFLLEDSSKVGYLNQGDLIAKKSKKRKKNRVRKKNLSTEGRVKRIGDKTSIDFDSVDISGMRRTPMGSLVSQTKADKEYDFVKIRLSWHPEMIKSAASLDTKSK